MRLCLATLLFLFVSLPASAKDKSSERIERIVSAGKTWMLHSAQSRLALFEQLDPANCKSGSQALAQFLVSTAQDEKLAAEFQTAAKAAKEKEKAIAFERMDKELASETEPTTQRRAALQGTLEKFNAACPAEFKAIFKAFQDYDLKLAKKVR